MRRLKRTHQRYVREQSKRRKKFRQRAIAAGTAVAITLGAGVSINKAIAAYTPDPHQLVVSKDADADLLANKEELAIGYQVFNADQNRSGIPDGVELAKRCVADINELPIWLPIWNEQGEAPNEIYKIEILFLGVETCDICGTTVNMGGIVIVNPALNLTYPEPSPFGLLVYLPYISLHYMEHGSFSYAGDIHGIDRLYDLQRMMRVLELRYPYEPNEHELPVGGNDLDGDFLADSEELEAGFNLYDPDQDEDLAPDGIELAKQCAEFIDQLPDVGEAEPDEIYKHFATQWGLETCDICGEVVNMGSVMITNPRLGITVDFPILVLHYMKHGSFSYAGDVHGNGRIDLPLLLKILELPRRCGDLRTIYLPQDYNKDCRIDLVDFSDLANRWLQCSNPNDTACEKF